MKKELPKMYQTKINKTIPSIQKVYSTINQDKEHDKESRGERYSSISVEQKID